MSFAEWFGKNTENPIIGSLTSAMQAIAAPRDGLGKGGVVTPEDLDNLYKLGGKLADSAAAIDRSQIATASLSRQEVELAMGRVLDRGQVVEDDFLEGLKKEEGSLHVAQAAKLATFKYGLNFTDELTNEINEVLNNGKSDPQFEAELAAAEFDDILTWAGIEGIESRNLFAPENEANFVQSFSQVVYDQPISLSVLRGGPAYNTASLEELVLLLGKYLQNPKADPKYKNLIAFNVLSLFKRPVSNLRAEVPPSLTDLAIEYLKQLPAKNSDDPVKEIINLQKLQISQEVVKIASELRNRVKHTLSQAKVEDSQVGQRCDAISSYLKDVHQATVFARNRVIVRDSNDSLAETVQISGLKKVLNPFREDLYRLAQDPNAGIDISTARELVDAIDRDVSRIRWGFNSLTLEHPTPVGGFSVPPVCPQSGASARVQFTASQ